jgi:hypothetical protein
MEDSNTEFVEYCRKRSESRLGYRIAAAIFMGAGIFLVTYCFRPWLWMEGPLHKVLLLSGVFLGLTVSVIGCVLGLIEAVQYFVKHDSGNDFDENEL